LLQAQLIDVDFNNNSAGSAHGGPAIGPTMSGAAVLGKAGDQWNGIDVNSGSGISLFYTDGSASPVKMTFTSGGGYDVNSFGGSTPFAGTPYDALMEDYLFTGGAAKTITLSGLAPNQAYNLVMYNAADVPAAGRETLFTINAYTLVSVWNGSSSSFIAGVDYVNFTDALSDGSGNMVIYYDGDGSAEGDVNGFQIQPVPNPTPTIAITNPASGTVLLAPANVNIAADADVSSGTVTNVQFFNNGVSLGSVLTAPFSITTGNLTAGTYALTAVATAAGISATSSVANLIVVNLSDLPKADNDDFNAAIPLGSATLVGYNFTATLEAGEPFSFYTNTVWWSWTAPNSGWACVDTDGSSFDSVLGVYSGNSVSALSVVAETANDSTNNTPNYLMFPAVAGDTYYLQVAGGYGLPGSYIVISVQPEGMTISDLQTNLNTNTGLVDFTASVEVANSGSSPQNVELDLVARAGYSWTQDASSNGIDFWVPDGLPPDQVLDSYFITNVAAGGQATVIVSNVCPAPDIIDSENFGIGWDIFVTFVGTYRDSVFLCSGPWPTIAGFNGPGGGVIRLDPSATAGGPLQLVSAAVSGPETVSANSESNYSVTVNLSNGKSSTTTNFISTLWSVSPPTAGVINSDGVFSAGIVSTNTAAKITASFFFAGTEYSITANITVIPPPPPVVPSIAWNNPLDIVYGTALGSAQLNATAASPANPAVSVPGAFVYNPPLGTVLEAGSQQTLSVTFTPTDTTTYTNAAATVTINVQKAPLTITANNQTKTYGQTLTFAGTEFSAIGLVNGDTVTSVTLASVGAAATVPASPYTIVASAAAGTGLANYAIAYANGALTVTPAALTITANNETKTYGRTLTFAGTEFSAIGLVNGDTVTSVTLASAGAAAAATAPGSPYAILSSAAVGAGLANYAITYANGALTVTPAALTITANNETKTYGQTLTFAGTEFNASGLVNGDTVTSVTLASPGAAANATSAGSPYSMIPSTAVGTGLANYTINYVDGFLTVTGSLPPPSLSFVFNSPNLVLSWPTNAGPFVLNVAASLDSPVIWTPVTAGITVNGANNTTTINAGSGNQYFELIAP
jgi:hypothetical protein